MFPLFNFRALFGAVVGVVAVVAGMFSPVRGHWDVTLAGVAGTSAAVPAVAAPTMTLTGFQAAPVLRRGPEQLRLTPGSRVDLDSRAPDWGAGGCAERCDLTLDDQAGGLAEIAGGELADKSATYHSCLAASEYGFTITADRAGTGLEACARTSDGRHAGMTVTGVEKSGDRIAVLVVTLTVWEAPPVTIIRTDEEEPPLFQDLPDDV
ncbi:hypothetical protein [Actinoplanes xinjiangensis]|uniref:hypothetical protein n=1 Tax=Actinoplanes xinjiangensis TaxID=512350 RepID=UPI00344471FA